MVHVKIERIFSDTLFITVLCFLLHGMDVYSARIQSPIHIVGTKLVNKKAWKQADDSDIRFVGAEPANEKKWQDDPREIRGIWGKPTFAKEWLYGSRRIKADPRQTRVVGGATMKRAEWPFLVSLHYLKQSPFTFQTHMRHLCGGALIHPEWVLTAGHCVGLLKELSHEANWEVVLGEHNQYLVDEGEQVVKPKKFFVHPGFKPLETNTLANDIALIQLNKTAVLDEIVGLIDISNNTVVKEGTECQVAGWGQVASDPYGWGMFIPLKATVYITNNETCKFAYDNIDYKKDLHLKVDDSVVCAGIPEDKQSQLQKEHGGNPDACNGDSGSPLLCPTGPNGKNEVVSVVSAGIECGSGEYPGIYTKVGYFAEWISSIMENN